MTPSLEYRKRKCILSLCAIAVQLFIYYFIFMNNSMFTSYIRTSVKNLQFSKSAQNKLHHIDNWRNLSAQEISKLSNLGRRLFLSDTNGVPQKRKFTIHVWRYLSNMHNRFIKRYTSQPHDPFGHCSVSNCVITSDDELVTEADAVLFHLFHLFKSSEPTSSVPRLGHQLWVLMADENPNIIMDLAKDKNLANYRGLFNWSMTYMMDADVPVPYGRTVRLLPGDRPVGSDMRGFGNKTKNIAIMGSNCFGTNGRFKYVKELQKHIPVDVYGGCGPIKCPGHFEKDCPLLNDYKFYLAFENNNCDDYITEKVWWHALHKGAVPVVMGAQRASYVKLLPPQSFIYTEDYDTPLQLADYLRHLLENPKEYAEYHAWRSEYRVLNEHGYFQTEMKHFCRLCEALNFNNRPREGGNGDTLQFLDHNKLCHKAKWRR